MGYLKSAILVLVLIILSSCSKKLHKIIDIKKINPLNISVINTTPDIKKNEIIAYNDGSFHPPILINTSIDFSENASCADEKWYSAISLDGSLLKNKEVLTISISNNDVSDVQISRVIPVSNWYTEANDKLGHMQYIPDALFCLPTINKNKFRFDINDGEIVQLFYRDSISDFGTKNLDIKIASDNGRVIKTLSLPIKVFNCNETLPKFNSIIFNNINLQSGSSLVETWKDEGFTHLQVNYVPTMYFHADGNSKGIIDHRTSQSTGFRNTAYPWIAQGGKILLFWESRYDKIAPLENANYITPFTEPWFKAYKFLIEEQFQQLKKAYPGITEDQIIIYLVDEFKAVDNPKKSYTLRQIIKFSEFLEKELPKFKTLVTYGYKSDEKSVQLLKGIDYQVPHVNLPQAAVLNDKEIYPSQIYKSLSNTAEKWMYSVESGKKAPLENFRFLPMIAVAHGYKGFSWYAFADHAGSTWYATDGNRLDYSLFYHKEPDNPIYSYWSQRIGTSEYLTSSLRLKAIQKGLYNAKLLESLLLKFDNLSTSNQNELQDILNELKRYNVTSFEKPLFTQEMLELYQEIEISLRLLHAQSN